MEISLSGRSAIITGGSKGLGLAIAKEMAASGADVAVLARDPATLADAKGELQKVSKAKVAAKNRSVKSTGKPRNSGRFLYRPANRKSTKLASMESISARRGKNGDDR